MGFAWGGQCYATDTEALEAFQWSMTNGDAAGITSFTTAPTINGAGVISWSISHRPLTGTTATTRTGTTTLPACTTSEFNSSEAIALIPFIAMFFAFCFGYMSGQQR